MFKFTDNIDLKKEFDKFLIDNSMKKTDIANNLSVSKQTVSNILSKKQLSFTDISKLLDSIDCSLYIEFRKNDN